MQRKINLTQVNCLRMGKTTEAKPHRVILRSPISRIHYYQSQTVTSIRNLTKPFDLSRNTNLKLDPYLNTQLDLYCSGNLFIQCTNPSTWLTNVHESQYVTISSNLKRLLAVKFFNLSTMRIKKLIGHKTLGIKMQ